LRIGEILIKYWIKIGVFTITNDVFIFTDDILSRLEKVNIHPPVIRKRQVAGLLVADDLAVGATTIIGLQRAIY
jgi:hypothetical protein